MSWLIENDKLVKEFSFSDLTRLTQFLQIVAVHADKTNHHPDVCIFKAKQMKVELMTHDKKAITSRDHALAKFIDEAYGEFVGSDALS